MDDTTRLAPVQGRSLRKPLGWGLVAILLLAAGGYGLWWWKYHDTLHYVTAHVSRGDIRRSINMTGALNPVVTAQVGSYVSGNIKSWSCDYNTQVKIGQQCALIDPLPFQVVVDEDTADVRTSRAQLEKDKAATANARLVYDRDRKLRDQGIVSQETLDADKSTLDQDVATLDLDKATIAAKEAALHAAQVNLGYTNIVSPVNGTVITRYIDVGYTVVSSLQSSTLFLIGKDMTSMQVDTNVSEADVGEVHAGQKASFTVQAYPNRTFEATVRQVRKGPITVQNVVTYDVVLDVANKDFALLPGMTSDTHIITAERQNVLRVPLPATRFVPEGVAKAGRGLAGERDRGGAARGPAARAPAARDPAARDPAAPHRTRGPRAIARLWVLRAGEPTSITVHTGLDDGTLIEVWSEELKEGDEVVVNAVRPNAPRPAPGERPQSAGQGGQPNGARGGGGVGFHL